MKVMRSGTSIRWSKKETQKLIKAVAQHGKDWETVRKIVNLNRTVRALKRKAEKVNLDSYEYADEFKKKMVK